MLHALRVLLFVCLFIYLFTTHPSQQELTYSVYSHTNTHTTNKQNSIYQSLRGLSLAVSVNPSQSAQLCLVGGDADTGALSGADNFHD